ncbi:MAG: hypothetical protein KVP17_004381 [Porospora cf. gigantea B]|uniref:uncharacterized protein n=1 Tax=Porospora cf. gigantea B TaxID=2853592 RepID=UPI0035719E87|nr:MAG: hypothetical protein KVP17_004381 [Porospora cf. gigantea B]
MSIFLNTMKRLTLAYSIGVLLISALLCGPRVAVFAARWLRPVEPVAMLVSEVNAEGALVTASGQYLHLGCLSEKLSPMATALLRADVLHRADGSWQPDVAGVVFLPLSQLGAWFPPLHHLESYVSARIAGSRPVEIYSRGYSASRLLTQLGASEEFSTTWCTSRPLTVEIS